MVEFWLNICKIRPRSADNRGRQINSFREGVERGDFKLMRTRLFVIGLDMSPLSTPDLPRFIGRRDHPHKGKYQWLAPVPGPAQLKISKG